MNTDEPWYIIHQTESLDTPSVVIYLDRVKKNIHTLLNSIDDTSRLRPHVKTHKSSEVTQLMLGAGIKKFKCATIAEAEMLALVEAPDVLLAYQPVGPKANRLATLIKKYRHTTFSCLIDNTDSAANLSEIFSTQGLTLNVFIDLNVGMNRTGIAPAQALTLFSECQSLKGVKIVGLHAYDGHIRDADFNVRSSQCDEIYSSIEKLQHKIESEFGSNLIIVAGGSTTYPIHARRKKIECSPGTFVYWDKGYERILAEQDYLPAALIVARIVSKPSAGIICTDLGHKAIASEMVLSDRVSFLNAPHLKAVSHSEEHMVFAVEDNQDFNIGDLLYGIPYHVCPTIALHDRSVVVQDHQIIKYWEILARNRRITI